MDGLQADQGQRPLGFQQAAGAGAVGQVEMLAENLPQPFVFVAADCVPIGNGVVGIAGGIYTCPYCRRRSCILLQCCAATIQFFFRFANFGWAHEIVIVIFFVQGVAKDVGEAAGHARAEIHSCRPEDDDYAGGHVFATVMAYAFDYC